MSAPRYYKTRTPALFGQTAGMAAGAAAENSGAGEEVLTVTGLTKAVRETIENGFPNVTVEGEISNFTDHRSGHRYWTLKDSGAQISAVLWKTRYLNFALRDGMKVVCRGRLSVYPPHGKYQLDVFQVRPSGIGDLELAYQERFHRLQAEGLFEEARKRPIPKFPRAIGIVTSENGAALHDMLTTLRRRWPIARVILRSCAVQGVGAELEIARAIQEFNLITNYELRITKNDEVSKTIRNSQFVIRNSPDILIVGRGGGSLEDLWCFNEEAVARAIFASKIPVISAVGHEVDFTIADYVADLRAPTPTAAAELATPDKEELLSSLESVQIGLIREMRTMVRQLRHRMESASNKRSLVLAISNALRTIRGEINAEILDASRTVVHGLERLRLRLERDTAKLSAMNPDRVLDRGFTALETPEGQIVPRLSTLLECDEKHGILIFADGRISVRFD